MVLMPFNTEAGVLDWWATSLVSIGRTEYSLSFFEPLSEQKTHRCRVHGCCWRGWCTQIGRCTHSSRSGWSNYRRDRRCWQNRGTHCHLTEEQMEMSQTIWSRHWSHTNTHTHTHLGIVHLLLWSWPSLCGFWTHACTDSNSCHSYWSTPRCSHNSLWCTRTRSHLKGWIVKTIQS